MEGLFLQILVVAKAMGFVKLGTVSLDGTKIKANASKHKAMSWQYAKALEEPFRHEVRELLKQAEKADVEDRPEMDIPEEDADAVTAMAHRLRTAEGKALYAKRKSTVETVFGIVKEVLGFRRFHLRGLQAAQGEWNLVCLAWNLKRMYALRG